MSPFGILLVSGALALSQTGGGTSPGPQRKVEVTLSLEHRDGEYVFVLEGATDLPATALLQARVYAVEIMADFRKGKREDEQPLVWDGDPEAGQPGSRDFRAGEGKSRIEVYKFRRKPWSLLYRGRIHYAPNLQDDPQVQRALGEDELSWAADLRLGTPESYARELAGLEEELVRELELIQGLFQEIRERFEEHLSKHESDAWKEWRDRWFARLEAVGERNRERYGLWIVWKERQAKMSIGGLFDLLRAMLVACSEYHSGQTERNPENLAAIRRRFDNFDDYLQEVIDALGVPLPLDPAKVFPILKAYEKGFEPLRAWIEKPEGEGAALARRARLECAGALFQLTPLLQNRKRAYVLVSELGAALGRLLDRVRDPRDAAALRAVLGEHDAALDNMKKVAGLK